MCIFIILLYVQCVIYDIIFPFTMRKKWKKRVRYNASTIKETYNNSNLEWFVQNLKFMNFYSNLKLIYNNIWIQNKRYINPKIRKFLMYTYKIRAKIIEFLKISGGSNPILTNEWKRYDGKEK